METPLQFEMHGVALSSHVRELIMAQVEKIENRFGRVTACRVAIRAPGQHHRMGEQFAVTIRLSLPEGREVNVGHVSNGLDARQADLVFAVNHAFRRAIKQLQRHAQKLRGDIKKKTLEQRELPTGMQS